MICKPISARPSMASDFVIILTTFPADQNADAFAHALVAERLAACVNVLPAMRSIYTWKGAVESADERQIVIKTTAARVRRCRTISRRPTSRSRRRWPC